MNVFIMVLVALMLLVGRPPTGHRMHSSRNQIVLHHYADNQYRSSYLCSPLDNHSYNCVAMFMRDNK